MVGARDEREQKVRNAQAAVASGAATAASIINRARHIQQGKVKTIQTKTVQQVPRPLVGVSVNDNKTAMAADEPQRKGTIAGSGSSQAAGQGGITVEQMEADLMHLRLKIVACLSILLHGNEDGVTAILADVRDKYDTVFKQHGAQVPARLPSHPEVDQLLNQIKSGNSTHVTVAYLKDMYGRVYAADRVLGTIIDAVTTPVVTAPASTTVINAWSMVDGDREIKLLAAATQNVQDNDIYDDVNAQRASKRVKMIDTPAEPVYLTVHGAMTTHRPFAAMTGGGVRRSITYTVVQTVHLDDLEHSYSFLEPNREINLAHTAYASMNDKRQSIIIPPLLVHLHTAAEATSAEATSAEATDEPRVLTCKVQLAQAPPLGVVLHQKLAVVNEGKQAVCILWHVKHSQLWS